jgi:tetratricopeptide (TPR) repeat protein
VEKNATDGEVSVSGPTDRINDLADSLGRRLLGALGRERPIAAVRQGPLGATSLPVLKAFLRGEQWYRRGVWDSALVYYDEAIAGDSTFSLALGRMALVLGWNPPTQGRYKEGGEYWNQAVRHRAGQSTQDSLMMAATLLDEIADTSTSLAGFVDFHRRSLATIQDAVGQYPSDPEVWYQLGESRYHFPIGAGRDYLQSLAAFDRAIALDPGFSPAYEHILDLALRTGQPDRAIQYARAAASLTGTDEHTSDVRLASRLLLLPPREGEEGIARQIDSAGPVSLFRTGMEILSWWPDSNETAVQVLRRLASLRFPPGEGVPFVDDSLMRIRFVAVALADRGSLREAAEADHRLIVDPGASPFSLGADLLPELALFGAVPDELAAKAFSPSLEPGVAVSWDFGPPRSLKGLLWWAKKGDTSALALFGRRMGEAARREQRPVDRLRARYLQGAAAAYLALAQRDSATALRRLAALPDTACAFVGCWYQKITEAALLSARGEDGRAAEILDIWLVNEGKIPSAVVARLDRARIAERLHDRETALRNYQFVLDVWRRADPELAQYVAEAKQGLARLTGEAR